ncbi:membrane protease subunit HflK [Ketogulonicigenium robustum]|uniref:Protein HflK n=1 Tax=Ketogulonicigenium robustum TaxID=92947 RepID=A0A1W6NXJ1_9RHOB|nr:FtsH protease activity modulator HflK [Ketogulonicigenium robustum]ARO13965.1 membrane protease subunit HflK [Ketogulonicigenium robustum]
MSGNNGGPWGGGGNRGKGDDDNRPAGNKPPQRPTNEGGSVPELDALMNKGREQLRVLMGGNGGGQGGGNGRAQMPRQPINKGIIGVGVVALLGLWAFASFYTVRPEEQSVELFLGKYSSIGEPGLNFAPWPFVTHTVVNTTSERTEVVGASISNAASSGAGLMLTTDANIVDIGFQVVWNINDPAMLLFNIADPQLTVNAVAESVMREIIAASPLAPILNRDRGLIADTARERIQEILNEYNSGINIIRVNLERADPPTEVIDSFREVQAAEQERDRLEREADAYSNRVMAASRGQAAQILEGAEAYRAQTVNEAVGQASRFSAVRTEYELAPDVTRQRIYIETIENVLGATGATVLDPSLTGAQGGSGVVPILPLNDLANTNTVAGAVAGTATQGN